MSWKVFNMFIMMKKSPHSTLCECNHLEKKVIKCNMERASETFQLKWIKTFCFELKNSFSIIFFFQHHGWVIFNNFSYLCTHTRVKIFIKRIPFESLFISSHFFCVKFKFHNFFFAKKNLYFIFSDVKTCIKLLHIYKSAQHCLWWYRIKGKEGGREN